MYYNKENLQWLNAALSELELLRATGNIDNYSIGHEPVITNGVAYESFKIEFWEPAEESANRFVAHTRTLMDAYFIIRGVATLFEKGGGGIVFKLDAPPVLDLQKELS